MWWSWILSGVGLLSLWQITKWNRTGFITGLVVEALWLIYAIQTEQWGFLPAVVIFSVVYVDAWRKWGPKIKHWEEVEERYEAVHDVLTVMPGTEAIVQEYWPEEEPEEKVKEDVHDQRW